MKSITISTIGRFNYQTISVTAKEELILLAKYKASNINGVLNISLSEDNYTALLKQLKKLGRL